MASGQIGVSTNNAYISGRIDWSSTPDVASNSSIVTATLYLSRTNDFTTWGSGTFYLTIDGNQKANSANFTISLNSNTVMVSHSVTVPHNGDGSKAISISCSGGMPGTSLTSTSGSATVSLDTIPRASGITSFPNFTIENDVTITFDRKSASFTHNLSFRVGATTILYKTGIGASYVFTAAEQVAIYAHIPNSTSATITLICETMNGSTLVGTASASATATVASSIVPTFTSITGAEAEASVSSVVGRYVQGLSRITFTINGASGIRSSTITGYLINFDGVNYTASSVTTGVINKSGNITATATITDSRGRTATKTLVINLLAYSMPIISGFVVTRANSDGSANAMGTHAKIVTTGSSSSLVNSTERNNLTYTLYSRARGVSNWTVIRSATTIAGLALNATNTLGTYSATSSFDFRLDISDRFNTTTSLVTLSTGAVTMSWGKTGVGLGKVWEQGALDVGGDTYLNGIAVVRYSGDSRHLELNRSQDTGIKDIDLLFHQENRWYYKIRANNGGFHFQEGGSSNRCAIHFASASIGNGNTLLSKGYADALRISTSTGYLDVGSMNNGYVHFATDRPGFYFEKPLTIGGPIYIYEDGNNYGSGLVGHYAWNRYQAVFSMGPSYQPNRWGTNLQQTYGIVWSYPSVDTPQAKGGLSHQALFVEAGVTKTAIGSGIWTAGELTLKQYISFSDGGVLKSEGNGIASNVNWSPWTDGVQQLGYWGRCWNGTYSFGFHNASDREKKYQAIPYLDEAAYELVKGLRAYQYKYLPANEAVVKDESIYFGIMADEAPVEILDHKSEKAINLYSYATLLMSALKQSINRIEQLELEVERIRGAA